MSTYTVEPGGRVLWCLRRRITDVRCVVFGARQPIEVRVLQDQDLVLTEAFPDETAALVWAREYATRLRDQGWRDRSEDCSPSSAA
jgi:hypothetical protein